MIILIDGLDEISPHYKNDVLDIIDDLKKMNTKIVITTRPHLREELEKHYGVVSYQMTKFNYENQKNFLINYWTLKSKNILYNDLEKKAEYILQKIAKSINDRERELTGIPLQLKLLSEIYLDQFNKDEELNLKLLYDKFVQKKYYSHCIEKKRINLNDPEIEEEIKEIFQKCLDEHEKLALFSLMEHKKISEKFNGLKEEIEAFFKKYEDGSKNYGIISQVKDRNVVFTHKTFQEYFISCYVTRNINKIEVKQILFKIILIEDDYKIVRLFLNSNLKELNNNGTQSEKKNLEKSEINDFTQSLYVASIEGHFEIVKYLIEKWDFDNDKEKCNYTNTCFILACENNHLEIVKFLVDQGTDVNAKTYFLNTGLILACENGHLEIAKYLVENRAHIKAKTYYQNTALMLASENGHFEIVRFLVENGADMYVKNYFNFSALILAAKNGHLEILEYLVGRAGANTSEVDQVNALNLARENGHLETVNYLVEKFNLGN